MATIDIAPVSCNSELCRAAARELEFAPTTTMLIRRVRAEPSERKGLAKKPRHKGRHSRDRGIAQNPNHAKEIETHPCYPGHESSDEICARHKLTQSESLASA
jgi:hypothetical protein